MSVERKQPKFIIVYAVVGGFESLGCVFGMRLLIWNHKKIFTPIFFFFFDSLSSKIRSNKKKIKVTKKGQKKKHYKYL